MPSRLRGAPPPGTTSGAPPRSAGILLFRRRPELEVLLGHPGGPFWASKDIGAWSMPKGEFEHEEPLEAARREFQEETGLAVDGPFIALNPRRQKSGKTLYAFALRGDCEVANLRSNTFSMEWPPRSGRMQEFPEIDRVAWFDVDEARMKIKEAQAAFLERLERAVADGADGMTEEGR